MEDKMRLWHEELISKLPRQQLLGQHRECCVLRGNGWGKKHARVGVTQKSYLKKSILLSHPRTVY